MKTFRASLTQKEAQIRMKSLEGVIARRSASYNIYQLMDLCLMQEVAMGWHLDPKTGEEVERNFGEVIALVHSELSEALEGARKDRMSDHIPGFTMVEEELADAIIRILSLAGALQARLGYALIAKLDFNLIRPDHQLAERADGGKQF